jgi:murein DD-endopeptidase MepM/ murein hydrolase activator NlpD
LRFFFDVIIYIKRSLQFLVSKICIKPIKIICKKFFYLALVPFYKAYLKVRSKLRDLFGLNEDTNLYLLTHRKTIHILIITLTVVAAFTNLQIGETRAESQFGKDILLASLVETSELGELVEERAGQTAPQVTSYSDEEDVVAKSVPGIEGTGLINKIGENIIATTQDDALIKPEIPSSKVNTDLFQRQSSINYIVKEGDTISAIARKFGLQSSTILWENDLGKYSIIKPGKKLVIPPIDGVGHIVKKNEILSTIAKKYDSDLNKIINYNNLVSADDISIGQKLFIPDGVKAPPPAPKRSALANLIIPSSAPIVSKNRMLWPTNSHRITQYYSWRHHGLDIGGKTTNYIYASDDGKVSLAKYSGWNNGYGKHIIIDHGNNKKTLYGHLSKNFVKAGQKVEKGEVIGMMGTTGRSSGVHLHFEVRFGSSLVNPLKYVK